MSYQKPLGSIQDYGQLATLSQEWQKAIFAVSEEEAKFIGTKENLQKAKEEFAQLYTEIVARLQKW
jgi:hypothetical protein